MTKYEKEHGGRTPAEDGERAAAEETRRSEFLALIHRPDIKAAAKQAAEAMAILDNAGLRVTDWFQLGSPPAAPLDITCYDKFPATVKNYTDEAEKGEKKCI